MPATVRSMPFVKTAGAGLCLLILACSGLGPREAAVVHPEAAAVSVDLAVLDALSQADRQRLEQHLTASAAWTVRDDGGRRVATRNWLVGAGWEAGSNGYWSDFSQHQSCPEGSAGAAPISPRCASEEVLQARVLIALSEPDRLTHMDRGQFTRAPTRGTVTLGLEDYMEQPGRNSWLVIEGEHLLVEIMEQTQPAARALTQAALDGLAGELAAVAAGGAEIEQRGFLEAWAPAAGWTESSAPALALASGERPGRYDVTAWLNAGEPGTLSMRLVFLGPTAQEAAPEGLVPGQSVPISQQLPGRLGWGADEAVRFAAETPLWIERGLPGEAFRGRLEVVLTPDSGSPERVLAATEQRFTGREPKTPPKPATTSRRARD